MLMGIKEIQEIIPHRHPFLLVDCIEELEPGVKAVGYKSVTYDEPYFRGHFPQEPVMPGVLIVEALAQTGAVAILSQENFKGKTAYFGGLNNVKFKHKVVPGDRLRLECEIIKQKGPVGVGKATATVDGKIAVVGELTFMMVPHFIAIQKKENCDQRYAKPCNMNRWNQNLYHCSHCKKSSKSIDQLPSTVLKISGHFQRIQKQIHDSRVMHQHINTKSIFSGIMICRIHGKY